MSSRSTFSAGGAAPGMGIARAPSSRRIHDPGEDPEAAAQGEQAGGNRSGQTETAARELGQATAAAGSTAGPTGAQQTFSQASPGDKTRNHRHEPGHGVRPVRVQTARTRTPRGGLPG